MFKLLNFLWWWEPTENEHANFEKKNWWKQISSSMNLGEDIYDGEGQNLKMRLSYFKDNLLKNTSYNRWGRLSIIYVLENIISLHSSGKHLNKFMYSALLHDYETDVKPTLSSLMPKVFNAQVVCLWVHVPLQPNVPAWFLPILFYYQKVSHSSSLCLGFKS